MFGSQGLPFSQLHCSLMDHLVTFQSLHVLFGG